MTSPADGAVYTLGQSVSAAYSCADQPGGSGVATCAGTVANGAPIDTASFGVHTFEVTTSDHAGNSASRTVSYSVAYDFDGFRWPVKNMPNVNRWRAGVPVPIRFSLDGFQGARPEADGYPRSTRCGGGDWSSGGAWLGKKPAFRYKPPRDEYQLLWKTDRRWAGTCREFTLKLDDGTVHSAQFQFARRGRRD